eukprot:gene22259-26847_t
MATDDEAAGLLLLRMLQAGAGPSVSGDLAPDSGGMGDGSQASNEPFFGGWPGREDAGAAGDFWEQERRMMLSMQQDDPSGAIHLEGDSAVLAWGAVDPNMTPSDPPTMDPNADACSSAGFVEPRPPSASFDAAAAAEFLELRFATAMQAVDAQEYYDKEYGAGASATVSPLIISRLLPIGLPTTKGPPLA